MSDIDGFNAVWKGKLLPLLQEYFYNDWDALRAVIGETGNNGTLICALPSLENMPRTRNRWRWYTDAGVSLNPFAILCKNYSIEISPVSVSPGTAPSTAEDSTDGTPGSTS